MLPQAIKMIAHKKDAAVESFYADFRRDVDAFKKMLPTLLQKFPGDYVAILGGNIIAHEATWEKLVQLTKEKYPDRFVLLEHVVETEPTTVHMDTLEF
jgi:hypothetical protein